MRIALIPPRGLEKYALASDFHLTLAQVKHEEYLKTYNLANARKGDYIVVDNGACEGKPVTAAELMIAATNMRADEVVLPDSIGDYEETMRRALRFWTTMEMMEYDPKNFKFQGVVQGKREYDLHYCVDSYATMPHVKVIGIPRNLVQSIGRTCRVDLAQWISTHYDNRFEIHFLGVSNSYLREVYHLAKYTNGRSIDSSCPFTYALNGTRLTGSAEPLTRPEAYFTKPRFYVNHQLVRHNIEVYRAWANATLVP